MIIQNLGDISGAHLNPAVSLIETFWGRLSKTELLGYSTAQILGGLAGILVTHLIFDLDLLQVSQKVRNLPHLWISEVVATFGLLATIALAGRKHVEFIPMTVAAYITGAYWFTSSTSFANPAVTIARAFTDTFCGIAPSGVMPFVLAEIVGAVLAFLLLRPLVSKST